MSKEISKVQAPKGLITPEQAKNLDQAFDSRHKLISSSILKRADNRSTWYALEEIETFLAYAKQQASDLGYTLDGIRIYEGAYPEINGEAGYTTMFIMPTGRSVKRSTKRLISTSEESEDIPDGEGLNMGNTGNPPEANYPQ
ncbi:hypothetical protein [Formosa algae]|uniref:Uncharacterized protein n=1 Tax=Formosa algae TaxID=225843 RepID=A0A9X0YJE3_9FLAO|nr:hypothetical protein [Formosa algae]MBP1839679.1 hypothetical protein [Formosa algae]MDQ0334983.1 hypothetical protein [Formosa algae]OEI81597.1 hypothetical protein AST99_03195 [Formosa algae]